MLIVRSLRSRIIAGFVAVLGLAIASYALNLVIAKGFQAADSVRSTASETTREAATMTRASLEAQNRMSNYLRTGATADRDLMSASFERVAAILRQVNRMSDSDGLKQQAVETVGAVSRAVSAGAEVLQVAADVSNPVATIGDIVSRSTDQTLVGAGIRIQASFAQVSALANRTALAPQQHLFDSVASETRRLREQTAGIDANAAAPPRVKRIAATLNTGLDQLDTAIDMFKQSVVRRQETVVQLEKQLESIAGRAAREFDEAGTAFAEASDSAKKAADSLFWSLVVSAILVTAFGLVLAVLLGGSIVKPIISLKQAIDKIAGNDFTAAIPGLTRKDEIGAMAKAVQIFKDNGLAVQRLEAETAEGRNESDRQRRSTEEERARVAADQAQRAQEQEQIVALLATGLAGLSQGDLSYRIHDDVAQDYVTLRDNFNAALTHLAETVQTIQATSVDVGNAAREINMGADDLSKRTEEQASSLEETAATTEELAASVKAAANSSKTAVQLADQAMGVARSGGEIVTDAVQAMSRIEAASRKISDIISVIDEIAFQTNLLALNAAVEAARAGDAGKGFAVVASEVRSLAQRSSAAAKDITALITESGQEVSQGVRLVRSAGEALERIVEASQRVSTTVSDISMASAEQANGIDEMSQTVAHMDEMTQQNAALAEESAASAAMLTDQIARLNALVAGFRTDAAVADLRGMAAAMSHAIDAEPQWQQKRYG